MSEPKGTSEPSAPAISREILQRAEALAEAIGRDPAVRRLQEARKAVQEREAARIMLRDLRERERALLRKQAAGQEVSQQEWEEFQRVAEVVSYNPYVRTLLEAEAEVARILAAVGEILDKSLGLPSGEQRGEGEPAAGALGAVQPASVPPSPGSQAAGPASGRVSVARSRLWVPGQP